MKRLLLLLPILIYVGASTWANLDLFPEGFMEYWWFDDLMHVLVFGAVALSLVYAFDRVTAWWWGSVAATGLAVVDELTQLFIPARAFSIQDLRMSLVGIGLATLLFVLYRQLRQRLNHR